MILIVAALIAASFFSLFEQAFRKIRKPRLQKEFDEAEKHGIRGRRKAKQYRRVLKALQNSSRYFMTTRFWIIALRSFAAIITGLSIGHLAVIHPAVSVLLPAGICIAAFALVVLTLSELMRRIADYAPEHITAALLPLLEAFALPLRPFHFLIQIAGKKLQAVFPPKTEQQGMTEDELRHALMEGEKSGIVESKEKTMVEGVFYLGDRPLGTFMTHRSDIQWLDINAPAEDIRAKVLEYRDQHCFPVADGTLDAIIGAAYVEDIMLDLASDSPAGLRAAMKKALFAPETLPALKAFESFKRGEADFLFVMDEYGGFAGMVRLHDLMEEIVGELTVTAREEDQAIQQEDGSWLMDGSCNIDDAAEHLSLPELAAAHDDYHTLAGFVLSLAGELPRAGDHFTYHSHRFTVVDMDGNRIDKVMIKKESH